ncbi:MAG TPA: DUF481 domain-containing protein [Marinobacter sp.]|nr:DUF481 domain-containing protein [Marinobacter sp.]
MRFEQADFMRAVLIAAVTISPLAQGQEGDNWEGEAELGVLISSGNTDESIVNTRLGLKHEVERWRNLGEFSSKYSESNDETTAEQYEAMAETNYRFHEQNFWFLRGEYADDRFSGYDFESSASTGYGNRVWMEGERSFLDLSVGAGYRYNKLDEVNADGDDAEEEAIIRLAAKFDYALSENALFRQKLSAEIGLDENNRITQSETSLKTNIVGNLSMKAAFRVKHASQVPDDKKKTDTETSLSLLYGF